EWDFVLPVIQHLGPLRPGFKGKQGLDDFDAEAIVGAVRHGAPLQAVRDYLAYYDKGVVKRHLEGQVEGFPTIFYAVASNSVEIVRIWVSHGASVSTTHQPTGVPLLGFAIANGGNLEGEDTTAMVTTLLSLGACPRVIPEELFRDFCSDIADRAAAIGQDNGKECDSEAAWCKNPLYRKKLAQTLNLSQRYVLELATKLKKPSIRHRQVARLRNAEAILGVPYFLIGQTIAAGRLVQKLLSYLIMPSPRPLVLVFAGPSGHGKTELSRKMGYLLNLPLLVVDCTTVNREMELFGPRHPYTGAERGSPLNNFLTENAGRRCVVFMDEFEKTTRDIHQALLLPFDNGNPDGPVGEYQDRRNLNKVDCSNTIWILATNAVDHTIKAFCEDNPQILNQDEPERETLTRKLSRTVRADFLDQFDAPVTGRISEFIPFLPFSPSEQAVVGHKFLLELIAKVRPPVKLSKDSKWSGEQLLGNVNLQAKRGAAVCKRLAADYNADLGARSMLAAVEHVQELLMDAYLEEEEEIVEGGGMRDYRVDVVGGEVV
ncbi:P-loop containing nucleoside triphosphate hydrolase protein, partial [Lasiosphaeris hirsuta]